VFKDCKDCPEMVVLPTGTFTMGTPEDEVGREPDEGPMHPVTFAKPLAISRFQILRGEWDAYLKDSGYKMPDGDTRPGAQGHRISSSDPRKQPAAAGGVHGFRTPKLRGLAVEEDRQALPHGQRSGT
jgi:formylglycine-generating enzyme required for sulfatase activity